MKVLVQRVTRAAVRIGGREVGCISAGLAVLVGVRVGDAPKTAITLAEKTALLRIFPDAEGKMNRSVMETGGSILAIPQFTLYADTRKGHRPGFTLAASPDLASPLFVLYTDALRTRLGAGRVHTGPFGADMQVELVNDGPVTVELAVESAPEPPE